LDYEECKRRLLVNRELLGNIGMRRIKLSAEPADTLLIIVDRPVLPHRDQYVRTLLMKVLRWRWGIAAAVGLMAVGMMRLLGQSTRSRSRLRDGLTKF